MLTVGSFAPEFALTCHDGGFTKMSRLLERHEHLVVLFLPQANSPGCTRETTGFRDLYAEFEAKQIGIVGITIGPLEELASFVRDNALPFDILTDPDHTVSGEWGAWRGMGLGRMSFVVDKKGMVTHVFPRVDVNRHAQDVLALFGGPRETAQAAPGQEPPAQTPDPAASSGVAAQTQAGPSATAHQGITAAELLVALSRTSLQLLVAHRGAGGSVPQDVLDLAARLSRS